MTLQRTDGTVPAAAGGIDAQLARAKVMTAQGDLAAAEALLQDVLAQSPAGAQAWFQAGALALRRDDVGEAVRRLRQAVALSPQLARAQFGLGTALHRAGALEEAAAAYARALALEPGLADACNNRGLVLCALGRPLEALEGYDRALRFSPDHLALRYNRGLLLQQLGRLDEALGEYAVLLRRAPAHLEALNNRGVIEQTLGRHDDAQRSFERVLAIDPRHGGALGNLGMCLLGLGRAGDALPVFDRALALRPDDAAALNNRGNALLALGRVDEAIVSYERATAAAPELEAAHGHLGGAYERRGRYREAIESYERALTLRPDGPQAHVGRSRLLLALGQVDEAVAALEQRLVHAPQDLTALSRLVAALNYGATATPEQVAERHREYGRRLQATVGDARARVAQADDPDRVLRVGYVSADLNAHSVSYFLEPVLAHHDPARFITTAYFNGRHEDDVTGRLRGRVGQWRSVADLSDDALADRIRDDRIDILVDLAGHTSLHRLAVFARRPAPVQLTWLGYPNTTGLAALDYRLTDAWADPPGEADALHAETLIRLPRGFLCYRPPDDAPQPSAREAVAAGREPIVFGSLNNPAKIGAQTVRLWSRVLAAVPGARLQLKTVHPEEPDVVRRLLRSFGEHGIAAARIEVSAHRQSLHAHLTRYHRIDIALDTTPYAGTTTTCEALWMGVPVITLDGRVHASRVGVSLLDAVGLQDLVAPDAAGFVRTAVEWAHDHARRGALRAALRDRMAASRLTDAEGFTRQFEDALRAVWRQRCAQR